MQKKRSLADNLNFGAGTSDIKSLLNRSTMLFHRLCPLARRLSQAFAPSIRVDHLAKSAGTGHSGRGLDAMLKP